ncbi:NAD(P)/FAD-dependent oxidoreductase [Salinibacter altiplanensis]|uniref:NAD(P)/FAD-dependent oxidoreductase n=1 Tax=Salinibacter altiplanensis TaxID=1803181 RepID=UPI000C9F76B2|nr:NAD(P)/FAD-dependent oxidoreductase [Salinibacter altiplanensis]
MPYDALVIGGGLAGCSTACQLAREGHDVLLAEQSTYPRQKLCGEFLSPEAQSSFRRLGMLGDIHAAGAERIDQACLTAPSGATTSHALPDAALGFSRYQLDQMLFQRACTAGVEGRSGTRVTDVRGSLQDGFVATVGGDTVAARLVLGAHGRRSRLDRSLERPFLSETTPYVAFKAHYAGPAVADLENTIELHSAPGAYCGLSPVEENRINVCWIGHADALNDAGGTPEEMLNTALRQNPALDELLTGLTRVSDRFKAVSQVPLMPKSRFVDDVCMIGDAAGMIAPLCGDGMAMALRTADLVSPLGSDFLNGQCPAQAFRTNYEAAWTDAFGQRMRLGRWIHAAAFRPGAAWTLVQSCRLLPPLARWMIRNTRGRQDVPVGTGTPQ